MPDLVQQCGDLCRVDVGVLCGENVHTDRAATALRDHPVVAVAAVPDDTLGTRLIALVVPQNADGGQPTPWT
ncbi:hypothetical protein ATKI12_8453 [Kitasatospora sp. Ki12]